ncbi:hypothetical protein SESBI_21054 [Sesbania bispinosa]|nr:hypothetical protein SESBI_21054 [Sesbania bispinosa]
MSGGGEESVRWRWWKVVNSDGGECRANGIKDFGSNNSGRWCCGCDRGRAVVTMETILCKTDRKVCQMIMMVVVEGTRYTIFLILP